MGNLEITLFSAYTGSLLHGAGLLILNNSWCCASSGMHHRGLNDRASVQSFVAGLLVGI